MVLAAVLTLMLTGCGGSGPVSGETNPAPAAPLSPQDTSPRSPKRDIVTTGHVAITVDDVTGAADRLVDLVDAAGGHVDDHTEYNVAGQTRTADLTLRIPAAGIESFLDDVRGLGAVTAVSLTREDVTANRVDLDARIAALQTSVDRLTALMKSAATTADLLAAEDALSTRQADLDSLRAQRTQLGDRIDYATITVAVSSESGPSAPGFVASVRRGWHALVAFSQGAVSLTGFLLPWLPVLGAAGWAALLWRRRRSRRRGR